MAKEAGLDMSEIKASISGLNFILKSGTRYGVAADELSTELEQLGLKSSHVAKLTAIYSERREPLTAAAAASMLRIAVPQQMNATACGQDVLLNLQAKDYSGRSQQVEFTMTKEQALLMLTGNALML
uniref:Uncharacterized protein n=1 Tax=Rhodnius prolixus TaxID=13249 RepID=T1HI03_RHOPR